MADFSGFGDKNISHEGFIEIEIDGVCDECGEDSVGLYSKKDKKLFLVCKSNKNHMTEVNIALD